MIEPYDKPKEKGLRRTLYTIIFEAETPGGKAFDVFLLLAILFSILVICLESVAEIEMEHGSLLRTFEWIVTALFTFEYLLRLYCTEKPKQYAKSFFGIIDLFSILPTFIELFFSGTRYLTVVRGLRLLRVFRILKMGHYMGAAETLKNALLSSRAKIIIFVGAVLTLVVIIGSLVYLIEGPENGFTSIPKGMYWAIVTLTTVGYGDITPQTVYGQLLASIVMIMGYGIIAVPTGIVTSEMTRAQMEKFERRPSNCCKEQAQDLDAKFCKQCGSRLRST